MWERVFVVSEFASGRAGRDDRTWSEEFFKGLAGCSGLSTRAKHLVSWELEATSKIPSDLKTHRAPNESDSNS